MVNFPERTVSQYQSVETKKITLDGTNSAKMRWQRWEEQMTLW